jgi:hypothetical protein
MSRAGVLGVGGLALALAAAAPAHPQTPHWSQQVREQLRRATSALGVKDAGPGTTPPRIGSLNGEESASFPVRLEGGVSYVVIGVCDNDCTDLQLVLSNSAKNEIASERSSENFPVLQFTPRETMQYQVRVVMAACQMNPCWYGVAVYRK